MMKIKMNKSKSTLILLIAAIILAVIVFLNRGKLSGEPKVIYEQAAGYQCNYSQNNGDLMVSSQEGVSIIDKDGNVKHHIVKSFANPVLVHKGDHRLFFDRKGTDLIYFKGNGQEKTIKTELPIINAKVNSVGNIAVATMETGYKGKIEVYNHKAEVIYKWQIGNSYVVDMDISPDCKRLCVALISMTGENVGTRIVMINLDKASIVSDVTLDNNIPFQVSFTKSNIAVIVTDTGVRAIDKSGKDKWSYSFEDKVLESFTICENGSGAFEFRGGSNNNIIELYNGSGKKCGEYVSQNTIVAIDATESVVAVTDGHFIKLLNWRGGDKGVIQLQTELKDVVVLDKNTLAAIGNNTVEAIKY